MEEPAGGVLDGIVHQIDDDLHHHPGVAHGQEQVVLMADGDGVVPLFRADVKQSLGHQLLHQLGLQLQLHPALHDSCDGQHVLHQVVEPFGVVVDIRVHSVPLGIGEGMCIIHQDGGIAGDGGQGGAQVVGDGAQKVCPDALVARLQGGLLLLPLVPPARQHQGALAQDGQEQTVFKGRRGVPRLRW